MDNKQSLDKVAKKIASCFVCKKDSLGMAVPGEGNPHAPIVFIGEAPGKKEAITGRPFIGRSGQFLRKSITAIGLSEEAIFITSVVKYLPVSGTPTPSQIAHAKNHLLEQLIIIQPKIIVLLGAIASQTVLGEKISIAKDHGLVRIRDSVSYFMSYHPAAAIRFQTIRKVFLEDFEKLKRIVKNVYS